MLIQIVSDQDQFLYHSIQNVGLYVCVWVCMCKCLFVCGHTGRKPSLDSNIKPIQSQIGIFLSLASCQILQIVVYESLLFQTQKLSVMRVRWTPQRSPHI